jgi:hypothetical protein
LPLQLPCCRHCTAVAGAAAMLLPPPPPTSSLYSLLSPVLSSLPLLLPLFKLIVDYFISPCHHRPPPLPPPFIFIVVAVAFIIALSIAIAAAAFSWLLFVAFSPAIAVSTIVFIATAVAAVLPQTPLSPQCHEEELWRFFG